MPPGIHILRVPRSQRFTKKVFAAMPPSLPDELTDNPETPQHNPSAAATLYYSVEQQYRSSLKDRQLKHDVSMASCCKIHQQLLSRLASTGRLLLSAMTAIGQHCSILNALNSKKPLSTIPNAIFHHGTNFDVALPILRLAV